MVIVVVVGLVGWLVGWLVVGCWKQHFFSAGKKIASLFGGHLTYQFCLGRDHLLFHHPSYERAQRSVRHTFLSRLRICPRNTFLEHSATEATVLVSFRERKSPKVIQTMTRL